jgi:hypothetical protein
LILEERENNLFILINKFDIRKILLIFDDAIFRDLMIDIMITNEKVKIK